MRINANTSRLISDGADIDKSLLKASRRLGTVMEMKINLKDSKALFRYANNRIKYHAPILALKLYGITFSHDNDKASILASRFASAFRVLNPTNPLPQCSFSPTVTLADSFIDFSGSCVHEVLANLKPRCSITPDSLLPLFFKEFALFLREPLSLIFCESHATAEVPDMFKRSVVTPVHKKGSKSSVEKYRPISQCSISSLIFEKILAGQLVRHLENNAENNVR